MFAFKPKSEEELRQLLPDGWHVAEIVKSEDRVSQNSGNTYRNFQFRIMYENKPHTVFDMLHSNAFEFKNRHFAVSADMMEYYDQGTLPNEVCLGKHVSVLIGRGTDKNGLPTNIVKDYSNEPLNKEIGSILGVPPKPLTNAVGQLLDDDISF